MKNATKKASEIIRELWDYDDKPTQAFNIDGKIIKTNLNGSDQYWNGNDIPVKYTRENNGIHYKAHKSRSEELDDCIAEGYDEIRFVLCASGMIRGYCDVFVWAHKSKKAQELAERADQAQAELQNEPDDVELEAQESSQENVDHPHPEAKYNVNRFNKRTGKDESMGIWLGDGMSNFKAGSGFLAGKFYCEEDEWIYYAEEQPQESSEPVAQENIQPEHEDATESISEPQEDADAQEREKAFQRELAKIRKRKEKLIPREMIEAYNRLAVSFEGKTYYGILRMYHEYKDIDGKFKGLSWGLPREKMITIDGEEFYIKKIRGEFWLYWEFRGDVERWLLTDHAKAYFNIANESNPEPSQSSSDEEKEITQENDEELTESNPEPLGDIKLSDFFFITEMLLMENSEPEWAYYHNNDLIWASSKRFSKDELLRMYANGYFMPYLTDKRKNLSRIQLKEYKTMGNTERCQNLWKQIEALDEEIARLFMNGARM